MSGWLRSLEPWGATLLRLVLGIALVYHGYGKVVPSHGAAAHPLSAMQTYAHFVASLGLPGWLGYVSALTEFLGGLLLVVGLMTRLAALLAAANMLVAVSAVTLHRGYGMSEYPIALFAMAVMLVLTGAGAAALDRRIGLV